MTHLARAIYILYCIPIYDKIKQQSVVLSHSQFQSAFIAPLKFTFMSSYDYPLLALPTIFLQSFLIYRHIFFFTLFIG